MPIQRTLHQSIDFSQIAQVWRGNWDEGTIYRLNDTVRVNGKAYVCSSTTLIDNNLFGQEYKPGVDTTNWQLVTYGSTYAGDWAFKSRYYAGDIVRYNGDFYQCLTDNFGGHPIYENGALTTKWAVIGRTREDKSKNALWPCNYPPMGWTRNLCETPEMYGKAGYCNLQVINGNYQYGFIFTDYSNDGHGLGERTNNWTVGSTPARACGTWYKQLNASFDFWDYMDGYNTTLTGQAPRLIQVCGTDAYTNFLFDSGEVYNCGVGTNGELGDGQNTTYRINRRVGRTTGGRGTGILLGVRIIKIGHSWKSGYENDGSTHTSFGIDNQGRVWTWGYNGYGVCGDGTATNQTVPTQIPQAYFHNKQIVDMWMQGCDYQSAFALTADGELYAWGYNGDGRLGLDTSRQFVFRPERVKYNWAKYGGIRKFSCEGAGGLNVTIVLTNDGTLHGCGGIGNGSQPIFGAGTTQNTWVTTFTPLAQILQVRANSLGLGNKNSSIGQVIDVTRNCDDYWLNSYGTNNASTMYTSLLIKEKGTGLMYALGANSATIPLLTKASQPSEYNSNNPFSPIPATAFPTLINIGNMTDIKYVAKAGNDTNNTVMFHNSDGRTWSNGSPGYGPRGIGYMGADPYAELRRLMKLPWEDYHTTNTPTQPRFHEPCAILFSYGQDSQTGFAMITSNSRLMLITSPPNWWYGWDVATVNSGSNASQLTSGAANWQRTEF